MKQVLVVVLVPLVIGVLLLLIEHKFIASSGTPAVSAAVLAPAVSSTLQVSASPVPAPASAASTPQKIPAVAASSGAGVGLEAQVALADRLYGVDPRNSAYVRIIDRAMAANDVMMALTVTDKLSGVDIRNDNYDKIINHAIKAGQLDFADKVAGRLYGVDRRNAALSRLLEARATSK